MKLRGQKRLREKIEDVRSYILSLVNRSRRIGRKNMEKLIMKPRLTGVGRKGRRATGEAEITEE